MSVTRRNFLQLIAALPAALGVHLPDPPNPDSTIVMTNAEPVTRIHVPDGRVCDLDGGVTFLKVRVNGVTKHLPLYKS